jgi:hypothetical protein
MFYGGPIDMILASIFIVIYIISVFTTRYLTVKYFKQVKHSDLFLILIPVINTLMVVSKSVFNLFVFLKIKLIKFIRWFMKDINLFQ